MSVLIFVIGFLVGFMITTIVHENGTRPEFVDPLRLYRVLPVLSDEAFEEFKKLLLVLDSRGVSAAFRELFTTNRLSKKQLLSHSGKEWPNKERFAVAYNDQISRAQPFVLEDLGAEAVRSIVERSVDKLIEGER